MTVSASVQAQTPCQATATQTDSRTFMSRSVQVDPPLPSPPRSLKVDTVNLHNTTDTKFHAGIPHVNYRQASAVFVKEEPSTIDLREVRWFVATTFSMASLGCTDERHGTKPFPNGSRLSYRLSNLAVKLACLFANVCPWAHCQSRLDAFTSIFYCIEFRCSGYANVSH